MKFLTVFAFACVATFVVLHSAYGSPLPEPVPESDPRPRPDVSNATPPTEPRQNPKAEAIPNPSPAASPLESKGAKAAGGDANFVALSANAEPMIPAPEPAVQKIDEAQA
ncbi:early nodulin-20 [Drosophila subpulchrella]|uniref:early nodulin-20 n=1 Tax=Drosophila subpulchrella TaxID=1486046 RepID=UPI0018A17669|nr:early nodulin-20 [Drosophila subpulchrella]